MSPWRVRWNRDSRSRDKQILAFRRRVGALEERMPLGSKSLRRAAWGGLQDSMPRAALLSLHARIDGVEPSTWEHPSLAQLWGPRYNTYVVPKRDFVLFSLGRRAQHVVRIDAWSRLSRGLRDAIEAEASALPLPGVERRIDVVWNP